MAASTRQGAAAAVTQGGGGAVTQGGGDAVTQGSACERRGLGGAAARRGVWRRGVGRRRGKERCWFDVFRGGVLGYLYWGGEGFA